MKRVIKVFLPAILIATMGVAQADNAEPNLKIGVIEVNKVLQSSEKLEKASQSLEKEFKPRQEKIVQAQKDIKADQEKLRRDESVMSSKDINELRDKIMADSRSLKRMQEDYVQDLKAKQSEVMKSVMDNLNSIVDNIAKDEHYDLILQRQTVAFASDRVDITQQVIEQLQAKNK